MPDYYATTEQIARLKQADKSFKRKSYKATKGCPGNEPHYLCTGNLAIATRTLGHKPQRKGVGLCYSEPMKGKKKKPAAVNPPGMALGMARSEAQRAYLSSRIARVEFSGICTLNFQVEFGSDSTWVHLQERCTYLQPP